MSGPGDVPVVVIGVGNEFRRDDGAGPAVVDRLRGLVPSGVGLVITDGEPARLIEAWTGAALAVVVDAVRAEPPQPGKTHRFVVDRPAAGAGRPASSHGFGLDEAIALARALDRMPGRLIVHAIEAADLTQGTGLTPPVAAAVDIVATAVLDDIGSFAPQGDLGQPPITGPTLVPAPRDPRLWPAGAGPVALKTTGSRDVINMRALVVYESIYGNTHVIASNVADGLRAACEVTLVPVAAATADLIAQADLLVVGGPTHMHGLSTTSSRQLATRTAAKSASGPALDPDATGPGLRTWLSGLPGRPEALAAAFDTRLTGLPALTGRASRGISRLLRRHGYVLVAPAESFLVSQENLLVDGETSRARRWGAALGAAAAIAHVPAGA